MAESISPERMQRLMELSNNAMTVELGALRNPQVTTVPSSINPNEAFYQIVPERDRVLNKLLREQYRNLESAQDRLKEYPDEADRLQKEIDTAQRKINEINSYPEEVVSNYIKKLQTEKINTLKDTVYRDFNPDFSLSNLDQTRDQIFLSEGQNEAVLAHELGHAAFKEAQNFFFQKMKELGSIEAAEKAVALEYGERLARVISNENFGQGVFPNLDEGTVQYYDNPLGDDPNNPGVGEPVSLDGKTYYQSGFEGIYDGNVRTDPLLQKPFTDYRTGELVYHDEYKGDFEGDLKKAGLRGFETLMSDLISEKKGVDRFAERQRRGLKINPLGAPKGEVLRSVRPQTRPENFAQGGPVMRGIGTLNETARNMFRGPRGIGAYQQLASGGEAMGPPPTRGPDPQGIGAYQQFADGGPVYMQEGGDPTMRQKLLSVIYDVESDGDYDQWNYAAKNIPETPITDMTVEQIMRYQGDENGPAAGAGQIKFNTFKTLLKMNDGLLPTDVFTPEVQDHANNRLLDRRGFNAWSRGEKSSFDFANDLASEWAGLPLVRDTIKTTGEVRKAGESRYGNNTPGISANNWLSAVTSAFGDEVPDQIGPSAPVYKSTPVFPNSSEGDLDLAMYAEDYGMPTPTGFTPTLRPQLRPQGIMSIQDPAVMDRVVEQVQEELPPTQEERDLYEKYSPENMFPDAGLTEGEMIRRERFAPKDGDAEPYRQPRSMEETIQGFFDKFKPSRKPIFTVRPTLKDTVV